MLETSQIVVCSNYLQTRFLSDLTKEVCHDMDWYLSKQLIHYFKRAEILNDCS